MPKIYKILQCFLSLVTMWINSCSSHNLQTCNSVSPSLFEIRQWAEDNLKFDVSLVQISFGSHVLKASVVESRSIPSIDTLD